MTEPHVKTAGHGQPQDVAGWKPRCLPVVGGTRPGHAARRGTIIHEALIAMLLATMVIVGAAEVMVVVSKQNRELERRGLARREAGNLMEEAMLQSWEELAAEASRSLELSETAKNGLPTPGARLAVGSVDGDAGALRVTIEVTWGDVQKGLCRPVRLVAWRYRPQEPQS